MKTLLRALVCISALWLLASSAYAANLSQGDYGSESNQGQTTCGGVKANGQLEAPCGVKKAVFEGDAVGECPPGSVFDVGLWSCWSCPSGYTRGLAAVDTERACTKPNPGKRGQFVGATFRGKACPPGSFMDPTRGGECWSCPSGYDRSAAPVEWADACVKPAKENFKKVNRHGRATGFFGTDCPSGQFWDAKDGHCYSCPSGYNRTGYSITDSRACSQLVPAQQSKATLNGKVQCQGNEIFDLINGGECWSCPEAADRTVYPINGSRACEIGGGVDFASATKTAALTCPPGQIFDLINARDPRIRNQVKQKFNGGFPSSVGREGGGSCWSCPAGYRRTVFSVWDAKACESNGISWKMPKYVQPGLFGLDGAEEVVNELIAERTTIEELAAGMAEALDVTAEEAVLMAWQEIAEAPETSGVLALAVLTRVKGAATDSRNASAAEKKLLNSFQDAVVHFRVFLANQSLQAYQAWDIADRKKNEIYSTVVISGIGVAAATTTFGASAAAYAMTAEAIKNELWPLPDFTQITLRSIIEDEVKGATVGVVYSKVLLSDQVLKKFFKETADIERFRAGLEGMDDVSKALAKEVVARITSEAGANTARLTSKAVMKAIRKAGPQLIADTALDVVIAWVEMQIERANAEPKLNALLAEAGRPFDTARLLNSGKGAAEVESQWSIVLAADTTPAASAGIQKKAADIVTALETSLNEQEKMMTRLKGITWKRDKANVQNVFSDENGQMYYVSNALYKDKQDALFKFDKGSWNAVGPLNIKGVANSPKGKMTLLTSAGKLMEGNQRAGNLRDVDGGASQIISTPDGDLWAISDELSDGEGDVWFRDGSRWQMKRNTKAAKIALQQNGYLWMLDKDGGIYRSDRNDPRQLLNANMKKMPGQAVDLSTGVDGSVIVLGTDSYLYLWDEADATWLKGIKAPDGKRIAVQDAGHIVMLSEDGSLHIGK